MITQTVTVTEKGSQNIIIGRRNTYGTEVIVFDLSYLVETYGNGSAVLMVKRSYDTTAYPAVTEQVDNQLSWVVTETDTSFKGHGECELFWYVDEALAKSVIYGITVLRDIGETTENPPDPYQTWVDDLTELGAETLENAQAAAQSATDAAAAKVAAETAQGKAETAQTSAETNALKSEGYAVGTQNGTLVSSGSPYYENNAEYMKDAAAQYALAADASEGEAAAWGTGSYSGNPSGLPVPSTAPQYHNNAYYYAQQASGSATTASNAKTDAENAQTAAETAQGLAEIAQEKAEDAQEAIENMTVSSTTLSAGSDATVIKTVDEETGIVNLAFGIPEGEQGESGADGADGFSPAVTITDISGGHTVTITDKEHPTGQSFNVMDGQDGASDAGEVTYDPTASYNDGTVGKKVSQLNSAIDTKADVIVDSVSSAPIASFPDGADNMPIRELTVTIEPVQDLHGYDAPWPAGGGANILDISIWPTTTSGGPNNQNGMTLEGLYAPAVATYPLKVLCPLLTEGETYYLYATNVSGSGNNFMYLRGSSSYWYFGETRTITQADLDGGIYLYVNESPRVLSNMMISKTALATWTPYANLCPISGWTGAQGVQTGKNLYGGTKSTEINVIYGGKNLATTVVDEDYEFKPGTYRCSFDYINMTSQASLFFASKINGVWSSPTNRGQVKTFTFTVPENCEHFEIWGYGGSYDAFTNIQIEVGSATATDYEESHMAILPISWQTTAGTVYGGTITVHEDGSVDLLADHYKAVAAKNEFSDKSTGTVMDYRNSSEIFPPTASGVSWADARQQQICNCGKIANANSENAYGRCVAVVYTIAAAPDRSNIRISEDLYQALGDNDSVEVCFVLAEPVEYHLDSISQIFTKLGTNNIWFDCGQTSLKYPCDTKLYIDKIAANIVAALS